MSFGRGGALGRGFSRMGAGGGANTWTQFLAPTNLLSNPNAFSSAPWSTFQATLTSAAALSPDQTSDAWQFACNDNNYDSVSQTVTVTNGQTYTLGVYAKAGNISQFTLEQRYGGSAYDFLYDLAAGTATINGGASGSPTGGIVRLANGWCFCWTTKQASGTSNLAIIGDGQGGQSGKNILIFNAQLKLGPLH